LLEFGSFNTYKDTTALMIVILDHLEVDIEIMGSDNCRELSENNRNTNGILAVT